MPRLAILLVTVTDRNERIVEALEAGADDYIVKPFHMRELTARIRAALGRARETQTNGDDVIVIVRCESVPGASAGYLMMHAGSPVTHLNLLAAVWGPQYAGHVDGNPAADYRPVRAAKLIPAG
jgi:two-component system KDP operon response regulator KdpE